jgi:hypothetical protein
MLRGYLHVMEKEGFTPGKPIPAPRPTLAEEQRRAFEEDQRRLRRAAPRWWSNFIFRN